MLHHHAKRGARLNIILSSLRITRGEPAKPRGPFRLPRRPWKVAAGLLYIYHDCWTCHSNTWNYCSVRWCAPPVPVLSLCDPSLPLSFSFAPRRWIPLPTPRPTGSAGGSRRRGIYRISALPAGYPRTRRTRMLCAPPKNAKKCSDRRVSRSARRVPRRRLPCSAGARTAGAQVAQDTMV